MNDNKTNNDNGQSLHETLVIGSGDSGKVGCVMPPIGKVLIINTDRDEMSEEELAKIKALNPKVIFVTNQEASNHLLPDVMKIKAPPLLPDIDLLPFHNAKSKISERNKRRKFERNLRKGRRKK